MLNAKPPCGTLRGFAPRQAGSLLGRLSRLLGSATLALGLSAAQAEPGVTANAIELGQTGAASGPLAKLNSEYLGGARLYFDAINRAGGVNGRLFRLTTVDDAYDPQRAVVNASRLIGDDGVFALFACFGTGPSLKVLPLAEKAGVPFFAPYTGADGLRDTSFRLGFHIRASYGQEITKMVDHLTSLGVTAIAVVHHADPFGNAGLEAARAALARKDLKPLLEAGIQSGGQNAGEVAQKLATANPAAVVMVTAGTSSVALIRAIMETSSRPMLYGLSVISSNQLITDLGPLAHGLVVSQVVPSPYRFEAAIANDYRAAAKSAGHAVSYTGLEGFIAAKVFTEAARRAGKELTRTKFVAALESLRGFDAGGFEVSFGSQRRTGSTLVDLSVISRGRFTN